MKKILDFSIDGLNAYKTPTKGWKGSKKLISLIKFLTKKKLKETQYGK